MPVCDAGFKYIQSIIRASKLHEDIIYGKMYWNQMTRVQLPKCHRNHTNFEMPDWRGYREKLIRSPQFLLKVTVNHVSLF